MPVNTVILSTERLRYRESARAHESRGERRKVAVEVVSCKREKDKEATVNVIYDGKTHVYYRDSNTAIRMCCNILTCRLSWWQKEKDTQRNTKKRKTDVDRKIETERSRKKERMCERGDEREQERVCARWREQWRKGIKKERARERDRERTRAGVRERDRAT